MVLVVDSLASNDRTMLEFSVIIKHLDSGQHQLVNIEIHFREIDGTEYSLRSGVVKV